MRRACARACMVQSVQSAGEAVTNEQCILVTVSAVRNRDDGCTNGAAMACSGVGGFQIEDTARCVLDELTGHDWTGSTWRGRRGSDLEISRMYLPNDEPQGQMAGCIMAQWDNGRRQTMGGRRAVAGTQVVASVSLAHAPHVRAQVLSGRVGLANLDAGEQALLASCRRSSDNAAFTIGLVQSRAIASERAPASSAAQGMRGSRCAMLFCHCIVCVI